MSQNEPTKIAVVTKYVIILLEKILHYETPIFCHTISSGYGALDILTCIVSPYLFFKLRRFLELQQDRTYLILERKSQGFNS